MVFFSLGPTQEHNLDIGTNTKAISNPKLKWTSFENKQKEQPTLHMWKPKLDCNYFCAWKA